MMSMFFTTLCPDLTWSLLILLSGFIIWLKLSSPKPQIFSDPAVCRQIIAGTFQQNNICNILSPHKSRANPNKRLKIAFGINNAFTRTDSVHSGVFVEKAGSLIKMSHSQWDDVSTITRNIALGWIERGDSNRINVTSMVQVLTMREVLWVMFDKKQQHNMCDMSLLKLAQSINRVWISSKSCRKSGVPKFEDDAQLRHCLFNVFGYYPSSPDDNPLNLILPAFETMWRVSLRLFLEIKSGSGSQCPEWQDCMIEFSRQPKKLRCYIPGLALRWFPEEYDDNEEIESSSQKPIFRRVCLAKYLIFEALRLYTPTRRVHRAYQFSQGAGASHQILAADIEGCHTRSDIWGPDALEFHPRRWMALTMEQKEAFMPFGSSPFQCPAARTFAPRMIGVLVGALLFAFDDYGKTWRLHCDDKKGLNRLMSTKRLDSRETYRDLYLIAAE
ncbi:hypothetical protein N7467_002607 [Penicillium canescens]|nr:hypothetical protein N7467_002607 [Penicillium canescens]